MKGPRSRPYFKITTGPHTLQLGQKTHIMGIVNLTPDSFSQDGCWDHTEKSHHKAVRLALKMIREGADIIDVGGESTRPGAQRISIKEELNRVIPTIRRLAKQCPVPISIDTYKAPVVQQALDAGATMVNNILGTTLNKRLLKMVKNYKAAIVLMHIRGTPRTMQHHIHYKNLIQEMIDSLCKSIENCFEIGIKSDKIIIDPGIGFGKTAEHNLEIINRLNEFQKLNRPILIGTSRKSFIGKILSQEAQDRLLGTAASVCVSILKGAHIVRVHDVKPMKEVALMTDAILNQSGY